MHRGKRFLVVERRMLLRAFHPVAIITVVALIGGAAASLLADPVAGRQIMALNIAASAVTLGVVASVERRLAHRYLDAMVGGWSVLLLVLLFIVGLTSPTQRGIATIVLPYVPLLFALFLPFGLRVQVAHAVVATLAIVLLMALPGSVVAPLEGAIIVVVGPFLSVLGCHLLRTRRHAYVAEMLKARRTGRAFLRQTRLVEDLYRQQAVSARRDPLTGVGNRLAMSEHFEQLAAASTPTALLLIDLDRFKQYNDEHGHLAGDEALRATAGVLMTSTRQGDRVYRFGGEEFLVVLPETGAADAQHVAERLRDDIAERAIGGAIADGGLTVSLGLAVHEPGDPEPLLRTLNAADGALYRAKRGGRNRLAIHPPPITTIEGRVDRKATA